MTTVDLNCDLGESFGAWKLGDDEAMFELVTSANIACGFHAGDPSVMLHSCELAASNGVSIGAHVSYRDLAGFGRRYIAVPAEELYGDVLYQLAALAGIAASVGTRVAYVKPHGALYNRIVTDTEQAAAVATAVQDFDPTLALLGLPDSAIERSAGPLRFVREGFVDRAYRAGGTLVPRSEPGALLSTAEAVTQSFGLIGRVESLCVHSDTPGAVEMARAISEALTNDGVELRAFA